MNNYTKYSASAHCDSIIIINKIHRDLFISPIIFYYIQTKCFSFIYNTFKETEIIYLSTLPDRTFAHIYRELTNFI